MCLLEKPSQAPEERFSLISFAWELTHTTAHTHTHRQANASQAPLCATATSGSVQLWSAGRSRACLARHARPADELVRDGEYIALAWRPAGERLAALTSQNVLHVFRVQARGGAPSKAGPPKELRRGAMLLVKERVLRLGRTFEAEGLAGTCCTALVADDEHVAVGRSDGLLTVISWAGDRLPDVVACGSGGAQQVLPPAANTTSTAGLLRSWSLQPQNCVVQMDYSRREGTLGVVFSDGRCAVLSAPSGLAGLTVDVGVGAGGAKRARPAVRHWLVPASPANKACFVRTGGAGSTIAMGCLSGEVDLFRLRAGSAPRHVITLGLADWGVRPSDTGEVSALAWAPGGRSLAAGWRRRGCAVWSASGCRLMCTIRQLGVGGASVAWGKVNGGSAASPPPQAASADSCEALDGGVADLTWGPEGFDLLVVEATKDAALVQLSFAKWCAGGGTLGAAHALLGADRVIEVSGAGGETEALAVRHHVLPAAFVAQAWPMRLMAAGDDGALAVAGACGLAVRRGGSSTRWRLFGDAAQERELRAEAIAWLGPVIAVACRQVPSGSNSGDGKRYEVRLYPRFHLDARSVLLRLPLAAAPVAMEADATGRFLLLATPAEDGRTRVAVYRFTVSGELSPAAPKPARGELERIASAQLDGDAGALCAAYIMPRTLVGGAAANGADGARTPPSDGTLGESGRFKAFASFSENARVHTSPRMAASVPSAEGGDDAAEAESELPPTHCLLLWEGGRLCELRLSDGVSRRVASDVESVWLSDGGLLPRVRVRAGGATGVLPVAAGDMPWWLYGPGGMQVYFPAQGTEGDKGAPAAPDAELEFDREVYPVGVSIGGAVVGVCQRTVATSLGGGGASSARAQHACLFELAARGQPVLPCLLRHLISRGAAAAALQLAAARSAEADFARSLEWLLFTALDAHSGARAALSRLRRSDAPDSEVKPAEGAEAAARLALVRTADLVAEFDEALRVVVSVARKTDADQRRALFTACGAPRELFAAALDAGQLRTAGCYLLVVSEIDGPGAGRSAAEELLARTLGAREFAFALEIVRFLLRAGREEELAVHEGGGEDPRGEGAPAVGDGTPKRRTWIGFLMGEPRPGDAQNPHAKAQAGRYPSGSGGAKSAEGAVHKAVRLAVERLEGDDGANEFREQALELLAA